MRVTVSFMSSVAAHQQSEGRQAVRVALEEIDATSAVRVALDPEHVERLAAVLRRCPPITLGAANVLIDGAHRVAAARLLGWGEIPALVLPVNTAAEVLFEAARANSRHGLPLTRAERRAAVAQLLATSSSLSDRALARACGVDRSVVARLRAERELCSGGGNSQQTRAGSDAKSYPAARKGVERLTDVFVRSDPDITVRALAERLGVSIGTAHKHRARVLARMQGEDCQRPVRGLQLWPRKCPHPSRCDQGFLCVPPFSRASRIR